jgi:SulP family sulfate permease
MNLIRQIFVIPNWIKNYQKTQLIDDFFAGIIATVLLVPQNLAYALLAGLPPEMGLYATIFPLIIYAWLGTSQTLAVGPVAVASLMTSSSLAGLAVVASPQYISLAIGLGFLSGLMLVIFGIFKLGFLSNFLSQPVLSGFTSGAATLIALSQINPLLGLSFSSNGTLDFVFQLAQHINSFNFYTSLIGVSALLGLWFSKQYLQLVFVRLGMSNKTADLSAKLVPLLVLLLASLVVAGFDFNTLHQVKIVGQLPEGLSTFYWPQTAFTHIQTLWLPALLIALVGFVQSVSVAKALALRRNEEINANQELVALGLANMASAATGGYSVMGGFARSAVNFAAGAKTQMAGIIAALLMLLILLGLTNWFYFMPQAVLAATIMISISSMIDIETLKKAWQYDKADAFALITTFCGVLFWGVQQGIVLGVALSLGVMVWRSSRPHMAVVGRVTGTEHYRNIDRFKVETQEGLIALRVDESLYFANASALEEKIWGLLNQYSNTHYVVLIFSAVNAIDATALTTLNKIDFNLQQRNIELWLAEVKGPVMDKLILTELGKKLNHKRVFLSTHLAFVAAQQRDNYNFQNNDFSGFDPRV